jgi:hypothetical protein
MGRLGESWWCRLRWLFRRAYRRELRHGGRIIAIDNCVKFGLRDFCHTHSRHLLPLR